MSMTATAVRTATLPRVNLLPPEIGQRKQLQRVQVGLAALLVAALAGVYLVDQNGHAAVSDAKNNLAASQARQVALQAKLAKLQIVQTQAGQTGQAEAMLTQAMASEVHFSDYMADLSVLLPAGAWFTTIALTESVQPGTLTTPAQAPPVVGNVSFSGYGLSHKDLATWLDYAATEKGFADPYFSQSTESFIGTTKVVQFSSTVNLTSDALTKRCAQPGVC